MNIAQNCATCTILGLFFCFQKKLVQSAENGFVVKIPLQFCFYSLYNINIERNKKENHYESKKTFEFAFDADDGTELS